jgi:anti-sigma factor RsiW
VIKRLRNLRPTQRHPCPAALSQYLDGDLDVAQRRGIEAHIRGCLRCRRELASLTDTIQALSTIASDQPNGLADSIIAALRNEDALGDPTAAGVRDRSGQPELKVLHGASHPPPPNDSSAPVLRRLRAAVRYCLSWSQLRLTLPITIAAGVVITMVNMPGAVVHGRIDLGVCLMCATDFLVPFLALNLVLLMLWSTPARSRGQTRDRRPA